MPHVLYFVRALLLAGFSVLIGSAAWAGDARPNIVFLLADDLGWTGLRCCGSDFYETPETQDLAASLPTRARRLRRQLQAWRTQVGAQMPTVNPDYEPTRATEVQRQRRK